MVSYNKCLYFYPGLDFLGMLYILQTMILLNSTYISVYHILFDVRRLASCKYHTWYMSYWVKIRFLFCFSTYYIFSKIYLVPSLLDMSHKFHHILVSNEACNHLLCIFSFYFELFNRLDSWYIHRQNPSSIYHYKLTI